MNPPIPIRPITARPTNPLSTSLERRPINRMVEFEDPPPINPPQRTYSPEFTERFKNPVLREQLRQKATIGTMQENKKLTKKQTRFVAEYLADPGRNAVQAAMRAGYTENSAYAYAAYLLKHPQIKLTIEQEQKRIFTKLEITSERVMQEVANCAFANMCDFVDVEAGAKSVNDLTLNQQKVIQDYSIEQDEKGKRVRLKLVDKLNALALLGKYLNMGNEADKRPVTINFLDKVVAGEISVDQVKA